MKFLLTKHEKNLQKEKKFPVPPLKDHKDPTSQQEREGSRSRSQSQNLRANSGWESTEVGR